LEKGIDAAVLTRVKRKTKREVGPLEKFTISAVEQIEGREKAKQKQTSWL
jgi:hypothetical protein